MTTTSFGTWNTTTDNFLIVLAGFKDKKDHLESDYTKAIMPKKVYLNDLDRGLIEGDRRPSSSIRLGFESLEEKWRWNIRGSSLANPPPGPTGVPMGVPAGAGVVAWCPVPPEAAAAAPNWCNRSWEEHWDWNYNRVIYYGLEWAKVIHP